jgi:hypothetical protein
MSNDKKMRTDYLCVNDTTSRMREREGERKKKKRERCTNPPSDFFV